MEVHSCRSQKLVVQTVIRVCPQHSAFIRGSLVEWFNQVDATYRADLRELNELNFLRFDAKLEQRVGEVRGEIRQLGVELRAEMKQGHAELRAELARWMFMFWAGTIVPLAGLVVWLAR